MPDGTALFFCDSDRQHDWLDDFGPTGTSADAYPLLVEIDHVSITESIDDFDQSTLFFRSVLGLVPGESTEITAPFGTHPQLVGERPRRSGAHHLEHHPAAARRLGARGVEPSARRLRHR